MGITREETYMPSVEEKAEELLEFEDDMYGTQRQLKKLAKRKRKRVVADSAELDEFQSKHSKITKRKRDTNSWVEEEQPQNVSLYSDDDERPATASAPTANGKLDEVDALPSNNTDISVRKLKKKKKVKSNDVDAKFSDSAENNEPIAVDAVKANGVACNEQSPKEKQAKRKSETPQKTPNQSPKTPKSSKKEKSADAWEKPLQEGEVEYVIPAKKFKNRVSITRIEGKSTNGDVTPAVTPIKLKSTAQSSTPLATPTNGTAASLLSTSLTSSRKKNIKIMLKMNQSQEAVEYIRQLKQSPSVPFDPKQKPLKGVLKPNLLPSPINPYYKKLIGMK